MKIKRHSLNLFPGEFHFEHNHVVNHSIDTTLGKSGLFINLSLVLLYVIAMSASIYFSTWVIYQMSRS